MGFGRDITGGISQTKTLAVFKNVVTKGKRKNRRCRPNSFMYDEDSSPSESELVIDEEQKVFKYKKFVAKVPLKEEVLNVKCEWIGCDSHFSDIILMVKHFETHVNSEDLQCKWLDCPNPDNIPSENILLRHLAYHAYLAKLVNIGENVLRRNDFPDCSSEKVYKIDIPRQDYKCEWKWCEHVSFNNYVDLLSHVECHVNSFPAPKERNSSGPIKCLWKGCKGSYTTRYRLGDHVKVHTKERTLACPQCMALFSSRTTFSDHRKRQLRTDMRSYQCSQCLKLFSEERLLSDHMRSHINQYKCNLCDMTCTTPSTLAKHYRYRHMNVRQFACQICFETFVTKPNLRTHYLTHENKPFKCDQCKFGCKSKVGLKTHKVKAHGLESARYECEVCKAYFKRGGYLTSHLIKSHQFHLPSGHSRFRYRKDSDGIYRLQTVRYESIEVTEQMINSESIKMSDDATYNLVCSVDSTGEYKAVISKNEPGETKVNPAELINTTNNIGDIIISIEDLDESGNIVKKTEMYSNEMCI